MHCSAFWVRSSSRGPGSCRYSGAGLTWLGALGVDHFAWRQITFGVSMSELSPEQAEMVVEQLTTQGVSVEVDLHPDHEGLPAWIIRSTNRHQKAVMEAIEVVQRKA